MNIKEKQLKLTSALKLDILKAKEDVALIIYNIYILYIYIYNIFI